ncbi:MAG: hypothetical protein LC803_09365 [Acidobacteria bacterium]|nr:hypothetical protein [Acidobacteriota bacterium]
MEDKSTTEATTQEQAPEAVQPEEQHAEAVTTADSEPQQQTQSEEQPEEPAEPAAPSDEDLTDYWAKKGIDISTPEGQLAAAKSYREAEKTMHDKAQKASELEKKIQAEPATNDDERVQRLELLYNANTWKQANNITPEQDDAMGTYLTSNPDKLALVKYGLLTFDDVLHMSGAAKVDTEALKKQGGQEALQTLANKQRATAPQGNSATTTTSKSSGSNLEDIEERLANVKF